MSPKKIDITGERYGMLTAIMPADNMCGRTAWLCRCDCGNTVVVKTKNLRDGRTTHCDRHEVVRGIEKLHYVDGTCIEMIANRKLRSNNTSGHTGVSRVKSTGNWRAEIMSCGKKVNLGTYDNLDDAIKARKEAEAVYHDSIIEKYSGSLSGGIHRKES